MRPYGRRLLALFGGVAATCLGAACAADPGDPLRPDGGGFSGSSSTGGFPTASSSSGSPAGSSSGFGSGSSSSGAGGASSSGGSPGGSSSGVGSSSSGVSSSSGSGGITDAGADGTTSTGPVVPEGGASCVTGGCPLKVQYKGASTSANTIGPDLYLINEGSSAVDLSTVKIHYYFTADGDTSLAFNCDYSGYVNTNLTGLSSASVSGAFVPMGANATPFADTYLEISFASASLPAGTTAAVNFRIHDASYATNYDQSNDWSFLSAAGGATGYVDAQYITAYVSGTLAWGIEPGPIAPEGGAPSPSDGGADATTPDASPRDASTPDAAGPDTSAPADAGSSG